MSFCSRRALSTTANRCQSSSQSTKKLLDDAVTALRQVMRSVAQPVAVITVPLNESSRQTSQTGDIHDQKASDVVSVASLDNHGATLSSLSSISLNPALVSFSLRLPSRVSSYLTEQSRSSSSNASKRFRVHLLSADQESSARLFARQAPLPTRAQPSSVSPHALAMFPPEAFQELVEDALGTLDCTLVQRIKLSELDGKKDEEAGSEDGGEQTRSELYIARVERAWVRSSREDGKRGMPGSLVYWDQVYKAVKA
ncbi:hypothetical protein ACM66B_001854 [Microbotryomycetes sp. NB124-2]